MNDFLIFPFPIPQSKKSPRQRGKTLITEPKLNIKESQMYRLHAELFYKSQLQIKAISFKINFKQK